MNYFYISGTSRGIGNALALELLKNIKNYVIGFSRTNSLKHERFEFIPLDLTKTENAMNFRFIEIIDAQSIVLINNSGMLGELDHIGELDNLTMLDSYMLNIVSPSILMNNFVKAYKHYPAQKIVINISSGAAQKAYESWSAYCASKSGLDMFTSVAFLEQGLSRTAYPVRFFSIAPGIVDTRMQDEIREADPRKFAQLDKFKRYKNENLLASPVETANRLVRFIENQHRFDKPVIDLREIDI